MILTFPGTSLNGLFIVNALFCWNSHCCDLSAGIIHANSHSREILCIHLEWGGSRMVDGLFIFMNGRKETSDLFLCGQDKYKSQDPPSSAAYEVTGISIMYVWCVCSTEDIWVNALKYKEMVANLLHMGPHVRSSMLLKGTIYYSINVMLQKTVRSCGHTTGDGQRPYIDYRIWSKTAYSPWCD